MAGRLSDAWLDDLRSRVDIVDVVGDYVQLRQKGRKYWGLCPFHHEKTPSFSVDAEAQMYYCFGCHEGGTAIQFLMQLEHLSFMEAVTQLAERVRIQMPETSAAQQDAGASRELKEQLYEANKAAAHYFHQMLFSQEGAAQLNYLHKRGLDDGDIKKFGLGASGSGWTELTEALIKKGFTEQALIQAGLTGRKEHRAYDMFRERVMFPIIDARGHVLGFGGRAMGDAQPKYLNTSDTPVFNKRQGLYAMNYVRNERSQKRLILVEGYMDVVSLRREGVTGVVATLGTALTEEQARLIKRYASEVWVSYDGDSAGQKAILRALEIFEPLEIKVRVLVFPDGQDPDDYIRMHGKLGFERLKPIDPIRYRMQTAKSSFDMTTQDGRTDYAIACCKMLRTVQNPVEMENHLQQLMMDTGFEKQVLLDQIGTALLKTRPEKKPTRRPGKGIQGLTESQKAERDLCMLLGAKLIPADAVSLEDFDSELFQKIAGRLLSGASSASVLDELEGEERNQAASALMPEVLPDEAKALGVAEDCLRAIRKRRLSDAIDQSSELCKSAEGEERVRLVAQISQLTQEMNRLRDSRKG